MVILYPLSVEKRMEKHFVSIEELLYHRYDTLYRLKV